MTETVTRVRSPFSALLDFSSALTSHSREVQHHCEDLLFDSGMKKKLDINILSPQKLM